MNNDTQYPLLLNEILVLFPALTIVLPVKKAHEYRRLSSQLKVRFVGKSLVVMRSEERGLYS